MIYTSIQGIKVVLKWRTLLLNPCNKIIKYLWESNYIFRHIKLNLNFVYHFSKDEHLLDFLKLNFSPEISNSFATGSLNIIFNTRADFKVLKGFKTEYAIKKLFLFFLEFFLKKSMDSPFTFFEFFTKKHPKYPPRPCVKVKFFIPPVVSLLFT